MADSKAAPNITGPWLKVDDSENHLEVAETAQRGLFSVRSTFDPSRMIYATARQIQALTYQANAPQSEVGQLIQSGLRA